MKRTDTTKALTAMCVGCKYSTIASGTEFICSNPTNSTSDIAANVIDTFFGEGCKCYTPGSPDHVTPNRPR